MLPYLCVARPILDFSEGYLGTRLSSCRHVRDWVSRNLRMYGEGYGDVKYREVYQCVCQVIAIASLGDIVVITFGSCLCETSSCSCVQLKRQYANVWDQGDQMYGLLERKLPSP